MKERNIKITLDKTGLFCWEWDCLTSVQDRRTDWSHVKIQEGGKGESTKKGEKNSPIFIFWGK